MIDFTVPEEMRLTIDGLLAFLQREVEPLDEANRVLLENPHAAYGADGRLVPEVVALRRQVRTAAARAGYYTLFTPADLGGAGQGPLALFFVWEALYHHAGADRLLPYESVAHWVTGANAALRGLPPQVREQVLPGLLSGERTSCFALSEPDAGSDIWSMKTRAVRDGDDWVLNGMKQWISYSPYAQHAIVFAVTDPEQLRRQEGGISCFFVVTDTPGFSVDSIIRLFGHADGNEAILSFAEMPVPAERIIGEPDQGFRTALGSVNTGRLYNCARSVGLGR